MILLSTVWHSGTHRVRKTLPNAGVVWHHCSEGAYADALEATQIVTTWRDPLRVAASWANRGEFGVGNWMEQWTYWGKLLALRPTVINVETLCGTANTYPDRFGLHKALDEGDMGLFWAYVPERFIQHALTCALPVGFAGQQFVETR